MMDNERDVLEKAITAMEAAYTGYMNSKPNTCSDHFDYTLRAVKSARDAYDSLTR